MNAIRKHASISGRVQGVGFRYWTRGEAERLGVRGWVRNEPDGRVEAELEGDQAVVDEMLASLRRGPPGAIVERIDVSDRSPDGEQSFWIAANGRGRLSGWLYRK